MAGFSLVVAARVIVFASALPPPVVAVLGTGREGQHESGAGCCGGDAGLR